MIKVPGNGRAVLGLKFLDPTSQMYVQKLEVKNP